MRIRFSLTVLVFILFSNTPAAGSNHPQDDFFNALIDLCGHRFEGKSDYPDDPGDDFRDALLVATIKECSKHEIRIPFVVGQNRSRTWILSRVAGGLQLKHDHRHADGSEDDITMYGGTTSEAGSALEQSFPADAHTAKLIPEASTNEWFLKLSDDGRQLTYYLERHGKPRFRAILTRAETSN